MVYVDLRLGIWDKLVDFCRRVIRRTAYKPPVMRKRHVQSSAESHGSHLGGYTRGGRKRQREQQVHNLVSLCNKGEEKVSDGCPS
jgi:hypothetical protein